MTVTGKFSSMAIGDVIQWARTAQRTGLITVTDDIGKQIQIVVRDGRITFSSTNDKRERWRGYLVYHGYCSEEDIEAAFRVKTATGEAVASTLVRARKITHEQAVSTLTEKTMEDLCDIFLWSEGSFTYDPRPVASALNSLNIDLDPIQVVFEGVRRAEIWSRMTAHIHPTSVFERTYDAIDPTGDWEDLRMAQHVWMALDGNVAVRHLIEPLPFSRYKIYRGVAELLEREVIRASDVTAIVDREKRIKSKVEDARAASEAGRWPEAMEMLQGLTAANPGRPDLDEELQSVTRGFERAVYEHNFAREDVPVITIGPDALSRLNLNPKEAFLLSRIDGRLTVRDILHIMPISEFDGLRAFKRLLSSRVIDFPTRKAR